MKKLILALFFILVLSDGIHAKEGHLRLLAVKEAKEGHEGAIADLYLEIKPGTGRVFLDTFPLTKIDTQISTRVAKDIACDYLEKNCLDYDFIYTIKADSPIIAGPSAGGAIALLTISMLKGFEVDEQVSITGTINSGGIIGSVGGVKEKIEAAEKAGLKKVLIPEGERFVREDIEVVESIEIPIKNKTYVNTSVMNKTIDLVEYGKEKGLEVMEVSGINDALYELTGKRLENGNYSLIIDKGYEKTMMSLASDLCSRSSRLLEQLNRLDYSIYNETFSSILNLTGLADASEANTKYYSAASYCFGANVKLTYLILLLNNESENKTREKISVIERNIDKLEKSIDKKEKKSVTDLEAYAVVKERLIESREYKEEVLKNVSADINFYSLAYSFERAYSAFSWAEFFDHRGKELRFDNSMLESSCRDKIAEAEERYHYVLLFYPLIRMEGTRKEIDYAYEDLRNEDYELCLFKATKAKAESDVILSVSGIGNDKVKGLLDKKIRLAEKNIAKQVSKGNFPVLAYSYYEYADELKESDVYSSLLYSEYAIELSNLEMYFKQVKKGVMIGSKHMVWLFLAISFLVGFFVGRLPRKRKKKKSRKR
ncbi:hypothetical protein KY358_02540 [Candidatus Woesearchaeota archaeon]|nr:hypothetical protein [Candidatus Woesearchaeota archaeon]